MTARESYDAFLINYQQDHMNWNRRPNFSQQIHTHIYLDTYLDISKRLLSITYLFHYKRDYKFHRSMQYKKRPLLKLYINC